MSVVIFTVIATTYRRTDMSIEFSGARVEDPRLEFEGGVAAIDVMTLNQAAQAVVELGLDVQLPSVADVALPAVFDDLCVVEVEPGPRVRATIDTKTMTWALDSDQVHRRGFTDYAGARRRGVLVNHRPVAEVRGVVVTNVPTKLKDGRKLSMWFAEVPLATLQAMGYYQLFELARTLTEGFTAWREFDWIVVPAQQIEWEREMGEIVAANTPQVKSVTQQVWMALDETGVRVQAATLITPAGVPNWDAMKDHTFGAHHPVVMWLTEPGSTVPFAVVATTSDAWLDPQSHVSFDDADFRASSDQKGL
jgi:hypothetical protein